VRPGHLDRLAGLGGRERVRGADRLDADDPRAREAAHHRRRERADADLDRDHVRLHVDLLPNRRVALDDPRRTVS
jgi:hypothetical protein